MPCSLLNTQFLYSNEAFLFKCSKYLNAGIKDLLMVTVVLFRYNVDGVRVDPKDEGDGWTSVS